MRKLAVHPNKRYLMWEDGEPFFYLADTAWSLFQKLSKGETDFYLQTRAEQGFNAIQAVLLAETDGLRVPNVYGRRPLKEANGVFDPTALDEGGGYDYWQHVDYVVEKAAQLGLFMVLLPTWGDKYNRGFGLGPEIFTKENAYEYAKIIGKRYRDCWNVIWMLGGDRLLETQNHYDVIDGMGAGLREVDPNHLITFHPGGGHKSTEFVAGKDYIDFHTNQSGHAFESYTSYEMLRDAGKTEEKPFMDSEPRYEDHPACFNVGTKYLWNETDERQNTYWNLMEGACGNTYGNHNIWCFNTQVQDYFPFHWQEVLQHPGAQQAHIAKDLRLSRPYFEFRPAPELVLSDDTAAMAHQCAGRGDGYAYFYTPLGLPIRADLAKFTDKLVRAIWFNPRTGEEEIFAIVPPRETLFVPPTSGKGNDWVLITEVVEQ